MYHIVFGKWGYIGLPPRMKVVENSAIIIPQNSSTASSTIPSPIAPVRRLAKSFSVATSSSTSSSGTSKGIQIRSLLKTIDIKLFDFLFALF
jgi:hypothetical protein